jgi:hypothetical protein
MPAEKPCSKCGETKLAAEFYARQNIEGKRGSRGVLLSPRCRPCTRIDFAENYQRRKLHIQMLKYGISSEDYADMNERQQGKCAICGKLPGDRNHHTRLDVDHDHKTKRVRGLLCNSCNKALGLLYDDPKLLASAILYLDKTNL